MPRCSAAWRTTGAGSTTLPIGGLTATSGCRPKVVQVGVWNASATAVSIALRRITALGTAGAAVDEVNQDDPNHTILATALNTWTVAPTFVAGSIEAAELGAAIGSGVLWTFPRGIEIPNSTGDGLVVVPLTGTGQICTVSFHWDE